VIGIFLWWLTLAVSLLSITPILGIITLVRHFRPRRRVELRTNHKGVQVNDFQARPS
jgi:hypothetical protein